LGFREVHFVPDGAILELEILVRLEEGDGGLWCIEVVVHSEPTEDTLRSTFLMDGLLLPSEVFADVVVGILTVSIGAVDIVLLVKLFLLLA
jgi:hypothetical protein